MVTIDFKEEVKKLQETHKLQIEPQRFNMHIPNATECMQRGLAYFTTERYKWLPEYDKIVEWMDDNKGKGLFCIGSVGRGKTLFACKIFPVIMDFYFHKIIRSWNARDINQSIDEIKSLWAVTIDDVGTETMANIYGEKKNAFSEIVDNAERKGKMIVVTTNLLNEELIAKYGERTMDRLRSITTAVVFKGDSLRTW
jgi:DNA replication protein DnaC